MAAALAALLPSPPPSPPAAGPPSVARLIVLDLPGRAAKALADLERLRDDIDRGALGAWVPLDAAGVAAADRAIAARAQAWLDALVWAARPAPPALSREMAWVGFGLNENVCAIVTAATAALRGEIGRAQLVVAAHLAAEQLRPTGRRTFSTALAGAQAALGVAQQDSVHAATAQFGQVLRWKYDYDLQRAGDGAAQGAAGRLAEHDGNASRAG